MIHRLFKPLKPRECNFVKSVTKPRVRNTLLQNRISRLALPQIKTFPVQISGGYNAQVRLHLPPGLREEEITRYPMVVQV